MKTLSFPITPWTLLLILALASTVPTRAQQQPRADLAPIATSVDTLFSAYGNDTPGCAVGVIHQGEYVLKKGYGLANLEHDIPITPQTVFRTGSVSKQFTAMVLAILAERGEIDLDADVHTYLPDLTDYGHRVTIGQIILHLGVMQD